MKRKMLALFFGILFACVLLSSVGFVVQSVYQQQLLSGYQKGSRRPTLISEKTNQMVLGLQQTKLGRFPPRPPALEGSSRFEEEPSLRYVAFRIEPSDAYSLVPNFGALKLPKQSYRSITTDTRTQEQIWDVTYSIDNFKRREIPGEAQKQNVKRGFIVLGNSNIFGEGVNDAETFPSHLSRLNPQIRFYNYALSGLFPGEMLDRMRLVQSSGEILEKKNTVIYVYNSYHIYRSMGELSHLRKWTRSRPYYYQDDSGAVVQKESLASAQPIRLFFADLYQRCAVCTYNYWLFPGKPSDSDWTLFVEILKQIKQETLRLGVDQFYVVIYPNRNPTAERLIPYLEKAGINYIDYSHWRLQLLTKELISIPKEGHPTGEAHRLFAEALSKETDLFKDP